MTELNEQDRERIEQEACNQIPHGYQYWSPFIRGAEYATLYERSRLAERIRTLEEERKELVEKMMELLKAFNDSDKNYADWVATKELYMAFTGVNNILERALSNSQKEP